MDNYGDVKEAHQALLEKIILDAGLKLPDIYDGIYDKKALAAHNKRVNQLRNPEIYGHPK